VAGSRVSILMSIGLDVLFLSADACVADDFIKDDKRSGKV